MRFNTLFFTSTILFFASIDASSTKTDRHEPQRLLRGDTKLHEEERTINGESVEGALVEISQGEKLLNRMTAEIPHSALLGINSYDSLFRFAEKQNMDISQVSEVFLAKLGIRKYAEYLHDGITGEGPRLQAYILRRELLDTWATADPPKSARDVLDHLFPPETYKKISKDLLNDPVFELWYLYVTTRTEKGKQNKGKELIGTLKDRFDPTDVETVVRAPVGDKALKKRQDVLLRGLGWIGRGFS